jgi:hypothetical protein
MNPSAHKCMQGNGAWMPPDQVRGRLLGSSMTSGLVIAGATRNP